MPPLARKQIDINPSPMDEDLSLEEKNKLIEEQKKIIAEDGRKIITLSLSEKANQKTIEALKKILNTKEKELEEAIENSLIDPLTRIANRRGYNKKIKENIANAERYNTPFSIIMIDIDHFKKVNDTFGHPTGDSVIQTIARILEEETRTNDFVARYGGEEFIITLPNTNQEEGERVAKKLVKTIEEETKKQKDIPPVTISAGIAEYDATLLNDEKQIREAADQALYYSKENGRNRTTSFAKGTIETIQKDKIVKEDMESSNNQPDKNILTLPDDPQEKIRFLENELSKAKKAISD